tara:strand:+ start:19224 stop:19670 length:447 start_codon:yes stop_codon:yes gene_type:complete
MATFTGQQIKDTYDALLKLEDNDELTTVLKRIQDGLGNNTPLSLSTLEVSSAVDIEASGFKTPTGQSTDFLMADGSVNNGADLGDLNYVHNQGSASASWTIGHNLNKFPNAVVVDSAGTIVIGEVVYNSINSITINFTGSFSGKAYIN